MPQSGKTSIGKMFLHLDDAFVGNQFKPFFGNKKMSKIFEKEIVMKPVACSVNAEPNIILANC